MAGYAALVARGLGLPPGFQELIADTAPLHDIGKIGVPDHVLLKPGPLTPGEAALPGRARGPSG